MVFDPTRRSGLSIHSEELIIACDFAGNQEALENYIDRYTAVVLSPELCLSGLLSDKTFLAALPQRLNQSRKVSIGKGTLYVFPRRGGKYEAPSTWVSFQHLRFSSFCRTMNAEFRHLVLSTATGVFSGHCASLPATPVFCTAEWHGTVEGLEKIETDTAVQGQQIKQKIIRAGAVHGIQMESFCSKMTVWTGLLCRGCQLLS